jgi:hypothetical protein
MYGHKTQVQTMRGIRQKQQEPLFAQYENGDDKQTVRGMKILLHIELL